MRKIVLFVCCLILASPAFSQDLNRLLPRARRFFELSVAGNKIEAVKFVEKARQNEYLSADSLPMTNVRFVGLEFGEDPNVVYATFAATLFLPEVGRIATTPRVTWAWNGKDWFVRLQPGGNPFNLPRPSATPAKAEPLPFVLSGNKLDLGSHVQGEVLKATVSFTSTKKRVHGIYVKNEFPGLSISDPVWKSNEAGELQITLDTTQLGGRVKYSFELQALGTLKETAAQSFEINATVEERLHFSQTPAIIDPLKGGTVELDVENVSKTPLKPVYISSTNAAFKLPAVVPSVVPPGDTMKLLIDYEAQAEPDGASIAFQTAEPVLATSRFYISLNVKLPAPDTSEPDLQLPTLTPQELQQLAPPKHQ